MAAELSYCSLEKLGSGLTARPDIIKDTGLAGYYVLRVFGYFTLIPCLSVCKQDISLDYPLSACILSKESFQIPTHSQLRSVNTQAT